MEIFKRNPNYSRRHNLVRDTIYELLIQSGYHAKLEPKEIEHVLGKRPDIIVYGLGVDGRDLALDVSITHPHAYVHDVGSAQPGVANKRREQEKIKKHEHLCAENNMDFVPLIFETFGNPSEKSKKFLSLLLSGLEETEENPIAAPHREYTGFSSVALQKGASFMVLR